MLFPCNQNTSSNVCLDFHWIGRPGLGLLEVYTMLQRYISQDNAKSSRGLKKSRSISSTPGALQSPAHTKLPLWWWWGYYFCHLAISLVELKSIPFPLCIVFVRCLTVFQNLPRAIWKSLSMASLPQKVAQTLVSQGPAVSQLPWPQRNGIWLIQLFSPCYRWSSVGAESKIFLIPRTDSHIPSHQNVLLELVILGLQQVKRTEKLYTLRVRWNWNFPK